LVLGARWHVALAEEVARLLAQPRIGDGGEPRLLFIRAHIARGGQAFDHGMVESGAHGQHGVPPYRDVHSGGRAVETSRPVGTLRCRHGGGRRRWVGERRLRVVTQGPGVQWRKRRRLTGQHHDEQRQKQLDLHAPQRESGDRAELTALGGITPVVDQDAEERQVDNASANQHIP